MRFTDRLKELQEIATPGRWRKQRNYLARVSGPECLIAQFGDPSDEELKKHSAERWNSDAALVAITIDALPRIIDALEAANRVRMRLDDHVEEWAWPEVKAANDLLWDKLSALDALLDEVGDV